MTGALILLVIVLAMLAWFAKDDVAEYARFKALKTSRERQRRYAIWVAKQVAYFVAPSLIGLALLKRIGALATLPPEFVPLAKMLPSLSAGGDMATGMIIGAAGVGVGLTLLTTLRRKKSDQPKERVMVGDVQALLPRNRNELALTALLSVSAGVTEELMFRLFLPLLIVLVTGNVIVAFAVPLVIFGLMHRYQGWIGVVMTGVVGAVFAGVYLVTQSLWVAMLAHAVLDMNGLVLGPMLRGALRPASD